MPRFAINQSQLFPKKVMYVSMFDRGMTAEFAAAVVSIFATISHIMKQLHRSTTEASARDHDKDITTTS